MFLILFTSKFVILEAVNIVFGDSVELGGLVEIVIIVIALIGAEAAFRAVFVLLGDQHTQRDRGHRGGCCQPSQDPS